MALTFSINEQAILGLVASDFSYKKHRQIGVGVDKLHSFLGLHYSSVSKVIKQAGGGIA